MQKEKGKDQTEEETEQEYTTKSEADEVIDEYKEEAARRDTTPNATLYKYENESGKNKQFAGYFRGDEIPSRHNIGLLFGSGKYQLLLKQPKGKAKQPEQDTLIFKIHEIYDQHKAKAEAEKAKKDYAIQAAADPTGSSGSLQSTQTFQQVKEILSLILPLVKETQKTQQLRQETPQESLNNWATMQKLLKQNLFDTAETYRNFNQRYLEQDNEEGGDPVETTEKEPNILNTIIKLIEPFFNLIAQKSAAGKLVADGLRQAPQFIEVLNDPQLCSMIISYFDRTKGKEKANIALKNIGIDREKLLQVLNKNQKPGAVDQSGTPKNNANKAR